jgi:glycosyltransferase involved in cell wall biosynthesis
LLDDRDGVSSDEEIYSEARFVGVEKQMEDYSREKDLRRLRIFVLGIRGFPDVQGGVEKHGEELYPRLVKLGCEVTVFTRTPYIPKKKRLFEWREVKFFYLWCPKQKYLETILHTFFGVLIAATKFPDILHIHAIGPSLMVPLAKSLGMKVIVTNHGPDYMRQKWGKLAKMVLRLGEFCAAKFCDKMVVISKNIKELIEKKYGRGDLELILNGVNGQEIVPPGETLMRYGIEPKRYVFAACRFVPEKGLHDLMNAYLQLRDRPFKLVIAGDADHETEYSRKIKEMAKKGEGIILTGFTSGRPLAELFSNAGLFILPSYYEGLPIALLEALSYGLPALVSDIPANREVPLKDFRFFPPGDISMLSQKMVELFKSGISEEERERNRELLVENYNWDAIAQKTYSIYASMVS